MLPESLVSRIRGEYRERPGLKLTVTQACRLWRVDARKCQLLLDQLVREQFLSKTARGAFVAWPSGTRQLKIDPSQGALRRQA